ncbi:MULTISPECIES: hypothetical protein [Roseomonadaceae]|uniref:DUF304 domain-containing protein n=1 Tax=Falsiroseomonas oleicola TaxID=2801474 RepID=A0ABS6HAK1_9PROT|nr:hypothetical protein [Roseomonas oleicola]MBU8545765.1 hypothetical protein [Roseomonas oleicola]
MANGKRRFRIRENIPSWADLRALGEIRAINNISYALLLMVPVLAAVWPVGRSLLADFDVNMPHLPSGLVSAFFASLGIFLAHIIYQWRCPAVIKNLSLQDYQVRQVSFYDAVTTDGFIETYCDQVSTLSATVDRDKVGGDLFDLVWELPLVRRQIEHQKGLQVSQSVAVSKAAKADIVRRLANVEYLVLSNKQPNFRLVCAMFYGMSVILVAAIVFRQVYFVAREGGLL